MPRNMTTFAIIVVLVLAGISYLYLGRTHQLPEGLLQVNGRVEGDTVIIAGKQSGKVIAIHVQEGDDVKADQLLVELDDIASRARVAEAHAAKAVAIAQVEQSRAEYDVLSQEVPYSIAAASAGVSANEARLKQAAAEEQQASMERDRYWTLAEANSIGWEVAERADLKWRLTQDQLKAVDAALTQSREALNNERLGPARIKAKAAQTAVFVAATEAAQAQLEQAQSALADLSIRSPAAGAVTMRLADLGEVVNAGTPLLELVDLDRLFLKVFIPEIEIGKVRLGLPAQIYIDAFPDTPFAAEVRNIASRAEFTPKEIQTPDERVKLVYAVKLYLLENPDHRLTPGLPADAVIRWLEDVSWAKPRW